MLYCFGLRKERKGQRSVSTFLFGLLGIGCGLQRQVFMFVFVNVKAGNGGG